MNNKNFLINNLTTDWSNVLNDLLAKEPLVSINNYLLDNKEKIIYPSQQNIFRAFNFFDIDKTKIVIFGQDPYHQPNQANGLAFSVEQNTKLPPSLRNIFKKLYIDKNIKRTNGDLSDWANQGILLLNVTLTVFYNQPNSHYNIKWIDFIKQIIEVLNNVNHPILFVCFGNFSKSLIPLIDNKHQIIKWPHPSPLAANKCGFFNGNLFDEIDSFVLKNFNTKINW